MKVTRRQFVEALAAVGLVPSSTPPSEVDVLVVDEFIAAMTVAATGPVGRGITALELQQDFNLLVSSGLEENRVLAGMSEAINQCVQDWLAAGRAIPEPIRPMVDRLYLNEELHSREMRKA